MSDSWLTIVGNILIEADKYVQFLKEEEEKERKKTESACCDTPKKNTTPGLDVCRYCHKDIYLARGDAGGGPYWLDTENKGSHCGTFHTPTG